MDKGLRVALKSLSDVSVINMVLEGLRVKGLEFWDKPFQTQGEMVLKQPFRERARARARARASVRVRTVRTRARIMVRVRIRVRVKVRGQGLKIDEKRTLILDWTISFVSHFRLSCMVVWVTG